MCVRVFVCVQACICLRRFVFMFAFLMFSELVSEAVFWVIVFK